MEVQCKRMIRILLECFLANILVADPRGGAPGECPPPNGPKFAQFHAVFGNFGKNFMLAPPAGGLAPLLGKSWIHPCIMNLL